jgi:amino acid transporter
VKNSTPSTPGNHRFLGVFTLAMLSVSAIISLRNLPTTALLGTQSVSFFVIAGLCFFIPVALVCAELAAGWPKKGGVYLWVEEAFGKDIGFLAVWLQWMESVVWLPTILSFIAATAAYLFDPILETNKLFLVSVMLCVLWGTTFLNFKGLHTSSLLSTVGVLLGTIVPGVLLIALGISQIPAARSSGLLHFSVDALIPSGDLGTLVTFTAILLGLCGMEIPAYHVQNAKNPQRDYPKAMFLATAIILAISIFGSLAIAAVVPHENMSLISGPMQAFYVFFSKFGLGWAAPILAGLTLLGSLALLNTWIIGPSKGLLISSEHGCMPKMFTRTNQAEVPITLLYLQAILGSLLISFFVFNPSIKAAYWMINTLAAQLYLIMYFIVFLAVIKLRYSQPNTPRAYKIPGGKFGVWLVGGTGAIASFLALLIGFVRPFDIEVHHSALTYVLLLLLGIGISLVPPFVLIGVHRRKNKVDHNDA